MVRSSSEHGLRSLHPWDHLENIGLIVIDEEHETTYKSDHTPKYDTIEVALKRMQDKDNHGILLLGSATPSVVSYQKGAGGGSMSSWS